MPPNGMLNLYSLGHLLSDISTTLNRSNAYNNTLYDKQHQTKNLTFFLFQFFCFALLCFSFSRYITILSSLLPQHVESAQLVPSNPTCILEFFNILVRVSFSSAR